MNLNDRIAELLMKHKIIGLTFRLNPDEKTLISAEHIVQTEYGESKVEHRCLADSPVDALERVFKLVNHCSEMTPRIVKLNSN